MINQPLKAIALFVFVLLLTACSQTPNYAPVKTVNQAIAPDNGYFPPVLANKANMPTKKRHDKAQTQASAYQTRLESTPYNNKPQDSFDKSKLRPPTTRQATSQDPSKIQNQNSLSYFAKQQNPKNPPYTQPNLKLNAKNPVPLTQKPAVSTHKTDDKTENKPYKSITKKNENTGLQENITKKLDKSERGEKNSSEKKLSIISIDNKKMLKLNFQWPLQGRVSRNFSQTDNKGILITGKTGQEVHAAETGKAVYCGQGLAGFGNLVVIKHNVTYLSAYANNSKLFIKEGQHIKKGQAIGQVGLTGLKKASLHFEIRKNGKPVNPLTLLPIH